MFGLTSDVIIQLQVTIWERGQSVRPSIDLLLLLALRWAVAGAFALMTAPALFASDVQGNAMPLPFEDMAQIVCVDQNTAIKLLAVYEEEITLGEKLLAHLAPQGACERATFSGKPVADAYPSKRHLIGKLREGHVFEVDITRGEVLKGRTRVYMLLFVMQDNEA
jgi:hypothetical protein